ncbi:Dynein light chain type 1 [Handroanthus impetiginosus]|uniref:Dynein light chain type 1 n=1 Tax=Handroanthus impetiginosus TaxID=429701 RepID=A0A2G9FVS9_9LAMI|nr:Dynein light chain type 1 [Handroanthus impetiginosus]PIM99176.1 Dynein light chain type 1 [Handroanthus impetiginosus]
MDPTHKKQTKSAPSTATHRHRRRQPHPHPHPLPDPTITPPSTIQNISHRFSKLYANHKKLVSNSFKNHPHPQPDPDCQPKNNPASDSSCSTLSKSSSQRERNSGNHLNLAIAKVVEEEQDHFLSSKTKVKEKDDFFKKPSSKKDLKKPSFEEFDVKKASQLMSKSLENIEDVKGFQEGYEMRRRNSVSSIPPMVNGGRRRSFCSSQVELADFFSCTGVKVVAVDMPPFMQIHAVDCARKAHDSLEKFNSKTLAFTLKKEFDGVYGPAWHCIVGTSFGSFVTHSVGGFMYFSMDQKLYILLFKTTVQRAD